MTGTTLGDFEKKILQSILNKGNAATGSEVRREILDKLKQGCALSTIYTSLDRLLKKGFVSSESVSSSNPESRRKVLSFSVTGSGQQALRESIEQLVSIGVLKGEI